MYSRALDGSALALFLEQISATFVADVPELSGCAADGATYRKALGAAEVVIGEWIETARELGHDIPPPRGRLLYA